ncbi:MAG: phospholipase, partial [Phototrophicales bacterium]
GLDYTRGPVEYSFEKLKEIASAENINNDINNTISILENWKARTGEAKPKMVIISVSGGGLSAAMYSMRVLQRADSLSGGQLLKHTVLMTGASGGTFATALLRELYARKQMGLESNIYDEAFAYQLGRDLLNPICFT